MTKTGRNDPCLCGSGKKYKRCCLAQDEAAERATRVAVQAAKPPPQAVRGPLLDESDELTNASNGVIALIRAGKIDQAEQAARDLLVRYPEVHDGYDRLGMVYEARGDHKQAADCYRQVIEFVRARPEQYDPQFATTFHTLIAKLDPPVAD